MAGKILCTQRRKGTAVEMLGRLSVGAQNDPQQLLERSVGKKRDKLIGWNWNPGAIYMHPKTLLTRLFGMLFLSGPVQLRHFSVLVFVHISGQPSLLSHFHVCQLTEDRNPDILVGHIQLPHP